MIHIFSLLIANELCPRISDLLIQAEFCHFNQTFSDMCAAPFSSFLCNQPEVREPFMLNFTPCVHRHVNRIYNVCKCGYRGGRRECITCELCNGRTTVMNVIHMCAHMHECTRTTTHTDTHTQAQTHMLTYTLICTPTYMCVNPLSFPFSWF